MDDARFKHRHILLTDTSSKEKFTSNRSGGISPELPDRDRQDHRNFLMARLNRAKEELNQLKRQRQAAGIKQEADITLTFQGEPGFDLKFESLEFRRAGIELL